MHDVDPKHLNKWWKSEKFRAWIHKNKKCYCGHPLSNQAGWLHHHRNTGGKTPLDQLLTVFCSECHETLHYSASSKEAMYRRFGISDERVEQDCATNLLEYLISLDELMAADYAKLILKWLFTKEGCNLAINGITELVREKENE